MKFEYLPWNIILILLYRPSPTVSTSNSYGNDINVSYFDQFLKTSTAVYTFFDNNENNTSNFSLTFNDTELSETFNVSETQQHSYGIDFGYKNELENNTKYLDYVEEMFGKNQSGNMMPVSNFKLINVFYLISNYTSFDLRIF